MILRYYCKINLRVIKFCCCQCKLYWNCVDIYHWGSTSFCNNLITLREIAFAVSISPNPTTFVQMIKTWAGRLKTGLRHILSLEALVVYKSSAAISLSFLRPWDSCIWSHTDKKKKKKTTPKTNASLFCRQTDSTCQLCSWALSHVSGGHGRLWEQQWLHLRLCPLSPGLFLVSHPQPCPPPGALAFTPALFQTSLSKPRKVLGHPQPHFWNNFWTQKNPLHLILLGLEVIRILKWR